MSPVMAAVFDQLAALIAKDAAAQQTVDHAVLERMLLQAGDPGNLMDTVAGANTVSHVPTSQPFVVPNYVQPTGKPVGS